VLQLFVILIPGFVSILAIQFAKNDFTRNFRLVVFSAFLSGFCATPWVQKHLHIFGQPETDVLIPPLFAVLYIIFGKYDWPSIASVFAGTYLTLIFGDLVSATISAYDYRPWWQPYTWIGGAKLFDGLVISPTISALAILYLRIILKRGRSVSFLYGRRRFLKCSIQ
jgi:uncharacterized membrane protein